ncbi:MULTISPECIES: hypothetical protein [Peptacetobacter]|uniref:Uncharacterized protein n=1 Tax=Peptacetobacter hiranonis (strain DSM 13275 / JCM 10541 / KCTC 15199 / TO-931) TaxID=500633 RepID=B6G231_PEPHT|nr:hypothetical protein [Peptacetobacter hiranonis]EEA84175.1 hypothetical protein CLOHIR_02193 [Peptacetobacter hiranonis DSM 13275]MEE0247231.1 hypothetical protein [Peptacetobacter hiranonis]QEK19829.1 hypothetical protein KGNDJEFE_00275 [Peptacetobacter hiranonis]
MKVEYKNKGIEKICTNFDYALDLVHPYRLIFEKKGDEIQIASIKEIVDYH